MHRPFICFLLTCLLFVSLGCEKFDSPPKASLVGVTDGILADPTAPLIIRFHEPVDESTLNIKVVRFKTDGEGDLQLDPAADPDTHDDVLFFRSPEYDVAGEGVLNSKRTEMAVTLTTTMPIGPQLAVVIEKGLKDDAGNEWQVRQIIKFGFEFQCNDSDVPIPTTFPDATHFVLVDVDNPLTVQLRLVVAFDVDPATGDVIGQFTNGVRDPSTKCGLSCDSETEVCRNLPAPECVSPSQAASMPTEYPDWMAKATAPEGFTVRAQGCIADQEDGSFVFGNAPVDVKIESPAVTVKGIKFNGSFRFNGDKTQILGTGTFTAEQIFLGNTASGAGSGTIRSVQIPDAEIKPGTPMP